jgi:monoamine oxidase
MLDLADELGIPLLDYTRDDAALDPQVFDIGARLLGEKEVLDGFAPIAAAIDDALGTLADQDDPFVYYDRPNNGQALDALSLAAWLDQIGAAGPVRTLLEVAYTAEYGVEPDLNNVLNLLFLISTDTDRFALFGESDERFHAAGGNDAFTTRLAAALGPAQLQLGMALEAVRAAAGGHYVLTFARGAGGARVDVAADHVVLALPFSMLRGVSLDVPLPPVKRRAIAELGYGANTKLMVGFRSRPWRTRGYTGESVSDRGYQLSWETSRLQPGAAGIITNFAGGERAWRMGDGTPAAQAALFLDQFEQVFPGVRAAANGSVVRMHWPSHPLTRGSYAVYLVGQYGAFAGAEIERAGNLHFCGEHTSIDHQGFMEGGAATGAMAAEEVAADLGLDTEALRTAPAMPIRALPGERIRRRARAARAARRYGLALRRAAV